LELIDLETQKVKMGYKIVGNNWKKDVKQLGKLESVENRIVGNKSWKKDYWK